MCLLLKLRARATEEVFWRLTATNKYTPQLPPFRFFFFVTCGRTQRKRTSQWRDTDLLHVERKRARENSDGPKKTSQKRLTERKKQGKNYEARQKQRKEISVGTVWTAGGPRRGKTLSSMRPALALTHTDIHSDRPVPVKRSEHEASPSPKSTPEVKNAWNSTSTPLCLQCCVFNYGQGEERRNDGKKRQEEEERGAEKKIKRGENEQKIKNYREQFIPFWVIPRRLSSNCRRFGTHYRFHLHRQVNEVYFIHLPMKMDAGELPKKE